eukprot:PITA_16641
MNKKMPKWHNRGTSEAALGRILDRYLIQEDLLHALAIYRQWVGLWGISDHSPIFLEVAGPSRKPRAPFKFNSSWLKDPNYTKTVTDFWQAQPPLKDQRNAADFCSNLQQLKRLTIDWKKMKRARDDQSLADIEAQLVSLMNVSGLGYLSTKAKLHLVDLETQRSKILLDWEELWRLRSRAIWLQVGDALQSPPCPFSCQNHKPCKPFPWVFGTGWNGGSHKTGFHGGIRSTLKWFKKDKSPGSDGWPVEFYIDFFDIIRLDLLGVVEESRSLGRIYAPLNSTFIALIPKTDSPTSFHDFHPISLCICLYKIIAKIIANRIKPILSKHISQEQFTFLHNRHIHEAIGFAQEALHSIKLRKLKGMALKIDLSKAFDKISWLFLRMILTHLGFPLEFTRWIMRCITSVSFAILINGSTSHSFQAERGIRQGCPLSPLLFLLVMEGLSRLIATEK